MSSMKKPAHTPTPNDIERKLMEAARREVADAEQTAARFHAVGGTSDASGDLVIIGKTSLGLTTVAIRMTIIQALALCANLTGSLSNTMQQQKNELMRQASESAKPS